MDVSNHLRALLYRLGYISHDDDAIEEIMENKKLRSSMSKFASNYVRELYNPKKLIENVVRYYEE